MTQREASDERRQRYGWYARLWSHRARDERATLSRHLGGARPRHGGDRLEPGLLHSRCVPLWHRAHGPGALSASTLLRTLAGLDRAQPPREWLLDKRRVG